MKHFKELIPLLLLILGLTALPAAAQGPDYKINRYTVAGGSVQMTGGGYNLSSTAGQPEAKSAWLTGGPYTLWTGYWQTIAAGGGGEPVTTLHLPLISKEDNSAP